MTGRSGTLYIVATPIGNLDDISARAINILKSVDLIASEDTRRSGKLLQHYGISTPKTSFYDGNERAKSPSILTAILDGKSVALICDAGTPLISDPGYVLVNLVLSKGIDVVPVPGASSLLAALVSSGFPSDRFCFEGYPPRTGARLRRFYDGLSEERRTIVIFETPHRISKSLSIMMESLGDREIFIGRELTKMFEEKHRGRISEILADLKRRPLKGEMVVIIRGRGKT